MGPGWFELPGKFQPNQVELEIFYEHALKLHDLFGAFFLLFQNDEDSVGKCEGKPQYIVNMRQFTINKTGGTVFFVLSEMTF